MPLDLNHGAARLARFEAKSGTQAPTPGMSRQGWHNAMKRAAIRAELEAEKGRFLAEVEARRYIFVAQVLWVALVFHA